MVSFSRVFAAAAALAAPAVAYHSIANCVPGNVVKGLSFTDGKVGAYAIALQAILPDTYGDLELLTSSDVSSGECLAAANGINSNAVLVPDVLDKFHDLRNVGTLASMKNGSMEKNYLYVFKNKHFVDYSLLANCVPGGVVGTDVAGQTGGKVGTYTILLKAMIQEYGDLKYLGKGDVSKCLEAANNINEGNQTYLEVLKSGNGKIGHMMNEVGFLESLKKAELDTTYLFVFLNKGWNGTWGVMDGYEETKGDDDGDAEGDEQGDGQGDADGGDEDGNSTRLKRRLLSEMLI